MIRSGCLTCWEESQYFSPLPPYIQHACVRVCICVRVPVCVWESNSQWLGQTHDFMCSYPWVIFPALDGRFGFVVLSCLHFILCGRGENDMVHVWKSGDKLKASFLYFCHMGFRSKLRLSGLEVHALIRWAICVGLEFFHWEFWLELGKNQIFCPIFCLVWTFIFCLKWVPIGRPIPAILSGSACFIPFLLYPTLPDAFQMTG